VNITVAEKIDAGRGATTEEALSIYDSLEPADVEFMLGRWKGEGFHTNHPMDGLLEAYHWHGKYFETSEKVHPLVFNTHSGNTLNMNPIFFGAAMGMAARGKAPKSAFVGRTFQLFMPFFATSKSRARLRMMNFRGKSCATMAYDQLPINDVFRKLDENTVLGIMDLKGMRDPFFFILRREEPR